MKKTPSVPAKKKSIEQRIIWDNPYCWLSAVCAAGISLVIAFCFNMIPFGDITILRMDMYHQYCPLFAEFYDRVTGLQSFLYSWETGMGSCFLGNFYNYLCSPSAVFVLLFGHKNVPVAIAAMIFSKAAFAAASFTYYIKKSFGKSDFATAAFGLLYCMCGWFIAYYWDVMWVDSMVFFPFVVLGIERIIKEQKPLTLIVSLFLILVTNYYMGYMVCIFAVLYFLLYYFSLYEFDSLDGRHFYWRNENGTKHISLTQRIKHSVLLKSGLTFGGASLAAGALAAFALLPVYFILKSSYATSDEFPSTWSSYFTAFDFLANHLSSLEPTIRSSGDVVLPNVYCGMATVMLVPLYLFTRSVPPKEKVAHVAVLAVLYASFNYNVISFIWHGFHYPSDLPYRFSFMYCFLLIVMAYKAFTRLNEFTGRQLLGTGVAVVFFIIFVQELGSENVEDISVILSIIFTVTYTLVLLACRSDKYQQSALAVLLLCCVIGETVCANTQHYDIDQPQTGYAGDYESFVALQERVESENQEAFSRSELTYNRARMDPAWYNYKGISTFTSMAYEPLCALEKSLGMAGNNVDSFTYYLQTPVYNMMHALKYVYDNDPKVTVEPDYYTELDKEDIFTAYENNYFLPLVYCVNKDIFTWYTESDNPFEVQEDWLEKATGAEDIFERMEVENVSYFNVDEITSGLSSGDIYYNKTNPGEEGEITFFLTTEETQHCYLYLKCNDLDSIEIRKNEDSAIQSIDDPYIFDLGLVSPDDSLAVVVTLEESNDYGNLTLLPYGINEKVLRKGYEKLNKNKADVLSVTDTTVKATVTVPENSVIYTSVPYDKGWSVELNGKKVPEKDIISLGNGLLCIRAEAGKYTLTMHYMPQGLLLGCAVSAGTLLLLIALAVVAKKRKKKAVTPIAPAPCPTESEAPTEIPLSLDDTAE